MIEICDVLSATCRYLFVELKVKAGKGTMNCTNERNLGLLFSCPKMRFSYVLPYRTVPYRTCHLYDKSVALLRYSTDTRHYTAVYNL